MTAEERRRLQERERALGPAAMPGFDYSKSPARFFLDEEVPKREARVRRIVWLVPDEAGTNP